MPLRGVDHGLGGRDNKRSQEKRAKKAARQAIKARAALTGGKKKELIFDESSRQDWLTGFGKRKQERRKFGLAMEVLKKKKSLQDIRKAKRIVSKEAVEEFHGFVSEDEEEENKEISNCKMQQSYCDDHTKCMFDGDVSVTIDTGISEDIDVFKIAADDDVQLLKKPKFSKPEPTKLEKALKIAKMKMNSKGPKGRYKKSDKTKLFNKALGSGKLGAKLSYTNKGNNPRVNGKVTTKKGGKKG